MAKKEYKPGETAPESGIYEIVGPRGGLTGKERVAEKGEPFSPTPDSGQKYVLKRPAKH